METEFDILLKLILDPAASSKSTQEGKQFLTVLTSIEKKARDIEKEAKRFGVPLTKTFKDLTKEGKSALGALGQLQQEFQEGARASEKYLLTQVKVNQALAEMKRRQDDLQKSSALATRVGARLSTFGNQASITGLAITGSIIAEATAYARKMGDATRETAAFNAELEKIAQARGRIDAVLVREVLPILQQATRVANIVANVVERNPEIANFALKGGAILVAIGAITKLASTGFKLYADATFFTAQGIGLKAAELQLLASNNQLAAAGKNVTGATTAGAGAGAVLGRLGLVAIGVIIAKLATDLVNEVLERTGVSSQIASAQERIANTSTRPYPGVITSARDADTGLNGLIKRLTEFGDEVTQVGEQTEQATNKIKGSANEEAIVGAFIAMREEEAEAERNFQDQRMDIISAANSQAIQSYKSYLSAVSQINERANENRARIIESFNQATREAEQKYQTERARILRDGNEEIQQIERDRLESLRRAQQEHEERNIDLIAERDALGLVLEKRRFDKEQAEINNQAQRETAERRQDLATRLRDLDENFKQERARRQEQFRQQLKENEERRKADLKREAEEYAEERKRQAEQRTQKLRDLQEQYNEERRRIRENFIAKIRDLDDSLLGEQRRRREYYAAMLADAERFLQDYRRSLPTYSYSFGQVGGGKTPRGFAEGGYTPSDGGLVRVHPNEFIANPSTTRALEAMIGTKLNQKVLLQSVLQGQVSTINWNDRRRFSGEYTKSMRRAVRNDTLNTIAEVLV